MNTKSENRKEMKINRSKLTQGEEIGPETQGIEIRDLERRIAKENKRIKNEKNFYLDKIKEVTFTLANCLAGNLADYTSLIDDHGDEIENLNKVVDLAVGKIHELRGTLSKPKKKIKIDTDYEKTLQINSNERAEIAENLYNNPQNQALSDVKGLGTLGQRGIDSPNDVIDLWLHIEAVAQHKHQDFIGDQWTHLAVKNENSYMIGTTQKGLKVMEDGAQVFLGKLQIDDTDNIDLFNSIEGPWLADLIYVNSLNCYFMDFNDKLYRKDIDDRPPYKYMDVICGLRLGASFRYSQLHERLIICKDDKTLSVINLESKTIEIDIEKDIGNNIWEFRLFGEEENRVVALTDDAEIVLYEIDYQEKTGSVVAHYEIDLMDIRNEKPQSIAVCSGGQYVVVEIGQYDEPCISSRTMIFRLIGGRIVQMASIDNDSNQIQHKLALECYGYLGAHIFWVGLSKGTHGVVQVYGYDIVTEELKEIGNMRFGHNELNPVKIHRLGEELYYTGKNGSLMKMKLEARNGCSFESSSSRCKTIYALKLV